MNAEKLSGRVVRIVERAASGVVRYEAHIHLDGGNGIFNLELGSEPWLRTGQRVGVEVTPGEMDPSPEAEPPEMAGLRLDGASALPPPQSSK